MSKVAFCLLTKDKTELTRQSIEPLLGQGFDLFVADGSDTTAGKELPYKYDGVKQAFINIRGGAGAGIVFALTTMLNHPEGYTHVGLCEQDVLCSGDWFSRSFTLFDAGLRDGLNVGAVSARCYTDRVLLDHGEYGVMLNLGAGLVCFTRDAARLVLNHFRSGWTTDVRRIFCQLSGIDVGPFWAFRGGDHALVSDWGWDANLAAHGYASLALMDSPVDMIGQNPPLAEQGLTICKGPILARQSHTQFTVYRDTLMLIREGRHRINVETKFQQQQIDGTTSWIYLPHQLHMIGGRFSGDWRFKEMRAFGEFGWVSDNKEHSYEGYDGRAFGGVERASFSVPVYGNAMLLVSGGKNGGTIHVVDESSGYEVEPYVAPEGEQQQCLQIPLPASVSMRTIRATFKSPGLCFYRLVTKEQQPDDPTQGFDHSYLPEPV